MESRRLREVRVYLFLSRKLTMKVEKAAEAGIQLLWFFILSERGQERKKVGEKSGRILIERTNLQNYQKCTGEEEIHEKQDKKMVLRIGISPYGVYGLWRLFLKDQRHNFH